MSWSLSVDREQANDLHVSSVFAQSLLSSRRPSWTPSLSFRNVPAEGVSTVALPHESQPSSPEDGGNFRRSLQIDNKGLVGDAVGNMSISPSSRDVVLAARRGLFVIDLEAPLEVPRFLPQGGTWDVADVQWNPHPTHAQYIVSTSSEKLLIWNLLQVGKTAIEHVLHSHYRAITDINWHTTEPETVVSTGIDSWIWSWDLRTPQKPVFGMCAFNAGGTQVKWNRQNKDVLASSHMNEVLVWDRRKGSLPISRMKAHKSKIYGIDWSYERTYELVTCSLDKTIKIWDVHDHHPDGSQLELHIPKEVIETRYPVWRARNLPFGRGVLSLPQRGEMGLEMFATGGQGDVKSPVEVFEGHRDVVKEFVWRTGGRDGNEYQLITWSKDKTLRFWPIDSEMIQKVGHHIEKPGPRHLVGSVDRDHSFRLPPEGNLVQPTVSAPIGHRGILAEVRAPLPPKGYNPVLHPHHGSAARVMPQENKPTKMSARAISASMATQGGTMTRGNIGGRSARIEMITWMRNVKEVKESRREETLSSGEGNGGGSGADGDTNSANGSRISSGSRDGSVGEAPGRNGDSRGRGEEGSSHSLLAEITGVIAKLESSTQSKIRLEKHDLTKKRTCTLGLYGPWGGSSSVFIRATFIFPKDYPQASFPRGIPTLEIERSPLVSMKDRAFMLRRLKIIREKKRPCLEPCLKFLLFGMEDEKVGPMSMPLDSESSSEGEGGRPTAKRSRGDTGTLLRTQKNLVEPRTSQGTFGANGQLVCFFRAPPRIVRNVLRDIEVSPTPGLRTSEHQPRLFQSPALLSDAVRRLGLAAADRIVPPLDLKRTDDGPDNILRTMTNLLTFSHHHHHYHKHRRESESKPKPVNETPADYQLMNLRRSVVSIKREVDVARSDRTVARGYVFEAQTLSMLCEENAKVASLNMRYDHARIFRTLQALFPNDAGSDAKNRSGFSPLAHHTLTRLYNECSSNKDIQMLAMVAVVLLQANRRPRRPDSKSPNTLDIFHTPLTSTPKFPDGDYFSLSRRRDRHHSNVSTSPVWPRPSSSPTPPQAASLSSSGSSRGPWSSLFNTGSMRHFMSGMQDTLKDGLATPTVENSTQHDASILVPSGEKSQRGSVSPKNTNSRNLSIFPNSNVSNSWGESLAPGTAKVAIAPPSPGHMHRSTFSQGMSPTVNILEKMLIFDEIVEEEDDNGIPLETPLLLQLVRHVLIYAERLFSWEMFHKRLELLKSVDGEIQKISPPHKSSGLGQTGLGVTNICDQCGITLRTLEKPCDNCSNRSKRAQCTICRLPVKGLSRTCSKCLHVTHLKCWNLAKIQFCASGCSCACLGFATESRPHGSSQFVQSPRSVLSELPSYL